MLLPEVALSLLVQDVQLSLNFSVKGDVAARLTTEICAVSACQCEQRERTPAVPTGSEDTGAGSGDLQISSAVVCRKHPVAQLSLSWQHL